MLVECRITEESDVITALALAVVLTLEVRVLVLVWLGDDMFGNDPRPTARSLAHSRLLHGESGN